MKKVSLCLWLVILFLEILPFGAVLRFGRPPEEGGAIRETFSYFDLTPFGYANFGPFITAVLSVVLFIMALIWVFAGKDKLRRPMGILSGAAFLISLTPMLFGMAYYSVTGGLVSAALLAEILLLWRGGFSE